MGKSKTVSIISLTLVALAFWGCGGGERPADTGGTGEVTEEALPEGFELLPGDQFNAEDYKGKVLVVDFWATWCPPCKMEIPDLIEINDEYGDKGPTKVIYDADGNEVFRQTGFMTKEQLVAEIEKYLPGV